MSGESICFSPDLLAGYDDNAAAYQEAVDELTNGSLPDEFDPCVDTESVPASFVINGLDPQSANDVTEYVAHKPYYQTRALLAKWWAPGSAWGDKPWPPEPAPVVSLGDWRVNPLGVIQNVAAIEDDTTGAATFAAILRDLPQTDRTLAAMNVYFGQIRYFSQASFLSTRAYDLANNRVLKSEIAKSLLAQFENRRVIYSGPGLPPDDSVALWREWTAELVPIFIDLHQKAADRKLQERLAEALAGIDGNAGIDYLAGRVLENSDDKISAFGALLSNALIRPEIAPHLVRMLKAPESQVSNFHKKEITRYIAEGRVAPDPGLASVVAQMLGNDDKQKNFVVGNEEQLVSYIAEIGPQSIPLLVSLATESARGKYPPYYLRTEAIRALAGMDSPKAAAELKKIIEGDYPPLPENYTPPEREAAEAIIASGSPAAHRAAIEILSDPRVADCEKKIILREMGRYSWHGGERNRAADALFLPALVALKDKNAVPFDSLKSTVGEIAQNQPVLLSTIEKYTEDEQIFIISAMCSNTVLVADESFSGVAFSLLGNPRLSPAARAELKNQITKLVTRSAGSFDPYRFPLIVERIFTGPEFSSAEKTWLLNDLHGSSGGVPLLLRIADKPTLPADIRKQAIVGAATTDTQDIETEIVARYIRNDDAPLFLREAAVDALKERAKAMPDKREHVRALLAACLPPPPSVQARIRSVLEEKQASAVR